MSTVHEAGHAAVFLTAGVPFDYLAFSAGPGGEHCISGISGINLAAADHVRCCVAGERASDRWLRDHQLWTPDRAWANEALSASDRRQLAGHLPANGLMALVVNDDDLLAPPVDGPRLDDLSLLHAEVDAFLDSLWPQVLRLGEALDRHGRLDYAQAREHAGIPCGR